MKEWIELLNKPTWMGGIALSIIGALYLVRVVLDFFKSTVLPRAYEHRLQRRKIVLPLAEKVLDASWNTSEYFRDGDPKLADFRNGCIFPRPELAAVRDLLQRSRFVYIQGSPSSGKTVIGLNLAYEWSRAKRTVLYFDRPTLLTEEFLEFLATPAGTRFLDRERAALVLDDVHLDVSRASRLFAFVYTNYSKLSLVFISRPLQGKDLEMDDSVHYNFSRYMTSVDVRADAIVEPLADFFSKKRFGHAIPRSVLKSFLEECGNDLLLLGRYLREWTGSSAVHLPEIRRKVFQTVRGDLEKLRSVSSDAVTALFVVSVFYKFEVPVERAFLEGHLGLEIASLLSRGELKEQNGFILLYHSSLAKLYANVCRSSGMPEYAALSTRYPMIPDALFAAYIKSEPRNVCEFIIRIRVEKKFVSPLLSQSELHEPLRRGLERESNLNYLGWAMLVLSVADHRNGWRVLKDLRFDKTLRDVIQAATPDETSLFLFNLSKVSQTKGAESLECILPENMARRIHSMGLGRAGATLGLIRDFSRDYFERVVESLEASAVCQQVLAEDDIDELKLGLRKLSQLLGDRVCIKVSETEDAFGEPLNRLSFYFDTTRVVRFLKGRRVGIPYGVSVTSQYAYWKRLIRNCRRECVLTVDDGAIVALLRRASLFPVGVKAVSGEFSKGEVVSIADLHGGIIGVGVSNFSAVELREIMGIRSDAISAKSDIPANRVADNDLVVVGNRFARMQEIAADHS